MSRPEIRKEKFEQIIDQLWTEYLFAVHKYPPFTEDQTALREITKQFQQLHSSTDEKKRAKQAIELAAMCVRYLIDCGKI